MAALAQWGDGTPGWLAERAATLAQWRSPARLAALALHWRDNRFEGDCTAFPELEAWRKQDKHLYDWQMFNQLRAVRWRDDLYRNLAATLRRRYKKLIGTEVNWREAQAVPQPEEGPDAFARTYMRVASVGRLGQILKESFGHEHVTSLPGPTTQRCHACGRPEPFDKGNLWHVCSHCGTGWDQDVNACRVLLKLDEGSLPPLARVGA